MPEHDHGDTTSRGDERLPAADERREPQGTRWPVTLVVSAALGVWQTVAPRVLGTPKPLADLEQVFGTLLIMFSVLAVAEPLRAVRLLNIPLAVGLLVGTWAIGEGVPGQTRVLDTVIGSAALWLAVPPGPRRAHHGGLAFTR